MKKISRTKKTIIWLLRKYLEHKADIEVIRNDTEKLEGPYLVIGNHANNWDPFLINAYVKEPINYVTSDEYFRKIITRYLLKYSGAIPKTKFISDSATVKEIIRRKKDKKVIGIFPEGRRNWEGRSEQLIFSTAKLIKMLKIPVVHVSLKGAYLSFPRWARYSRWGKILISYELILDKDRLKNLSIEEIHQVLNDKFNYDESLYQLEKMNIYPGKKLAERLELFLFTCPNCQAIGTLKSKDNKLYCQQCGHQTVYNQKGFFEQTDSKIYFQTPAQWNDWQLAHLTELIKERKNTSGIILKDKKVNLARACGLKLKNCGQGDLFIDPSSFYFINSNGNRQSFTLNRIKGLNIQYNNKLEFYYDQVLYRFSFNNQSVSGYKWLKALELSQQNN